MERGEVVSRTEVKASTAWGYGEYLNLPALLSLQQTRGQPPVHDEMLFVIVHQAHELWFKQILFELKALITDIDQGRWASACRTLNRLSAILTLLVQHVEVLDTMPSEEFQRFRAALGSASGMQSEQFRSIERLAGSLPDASAASPPGRACADGGSSSVREAFFRALPGAGLSGEVTLRSEPCLAGASEPRAFVWRMLEGPGLEEHRHLAERMLHFDEQMMCWRARHCELAQKMIGSTAGTGGSSGARYLHGTLAKRLFPELWLV